MVENIQFIPNRLTPASENLTEFIRHCRDDLTIYGKDFKWQENYWPAAELTFGNIDQKTRLLKTENLMLTPFIEFAKAYVRYEMAYTLKKNTNLQALRCLERALVLTKGRADLADLNLTVLDRAALIAKEKYSPAVAYRTGRGLAILALLVSEKRLVSGMLHWKNPNKRPIGIQRTGEKAKLLRDKKLPKDDALTALAEIFSSNPSSPRDIFTSSVCAMLMCSPSRISEILSLPIDCGVWDTQRGGKKVYGWRFQPSKGGTPYIKWIPESMETLAQEAISRLKSLSSEARKFARWQEDNPGLFYRHKNCPDVDENKPLSPFEAGLALGIPTHDPNTCNSELRRLGLSGKIGGNTLATLNNWVRRNLPRDFPWYDKACGIRYSEALFCLLDRQLHINYPASPVLLWKPKLETVNDDLATIEKKVGYIKPSIFDRHGYNAEGQKISKITTHQFRHLLNTMAQHGGLSQFEIARWSGRVDFKQNRDYDHMTEFELVDMLRAKDASLTLDRPLEEIAEQLSAKLPITRQEFNTLTMPTAHVTEYGFCTHDFTMLPCQRFRDCLNCTEQVCIKGDRRLDRIKRRYEQVVELKNQAEKNIGLGLAGADRWYEIHDLTAKRLDEMIKILENPKIPNGTIVKLRNDNEFSPLRRAVEIRISASLTPGQPEARLLPELQKIVVEGHGQTSH
ncbi:MAG: hypothetical protein ABL933_18465 [Methyloglobulus sp.]